MTNLRDLMHQTVEREHADMVRLASRARRQGTTMRRRRRLASAGTSLAVLAVLAVGAAGAGTLLPDGPDGPGGPDSSDTTAFAGQTGGSGTPGVAATSGADAFGNQELDPRGPGYPASTFVRDSGWGTQPYPRAGRALRAAVSAVLPGATITEVRGWRILADEHNPEKVSASVDLGPSGEGVSVFFLTGGWGGTSAEEYVDFCRDEIDDCQVSTLPDGTVVRSYSEDLVDTPTGPLILYRVDRLVDGVVIGVSATAGRGDDGRVLAANPPVTMQQLVDVAAQLQPLR